MVRCQKANITDFNTGIGTENDIDFVGRCDEFQDFCKNICLQVCSAEPKWVRPQDVPQDTIDAEKQIYRTQAKETGKPDHLLDRIAEGKLKKWFTQVCLLQQPFVRDSDRTIDELTKELSGKLGEKIVIRRFVRFKLGEDIDGGQS